MSEAPTYVPDPEPTEEELNAPEETLGDDALDLLQEAFQVPEITATVEQSPDGDIFGVLKVGDDHEVVVPLTPESDE